jgi:hypothetical protein
MNQAEPVWIISVQQGQARPVETPCDSGLVETAATTHGFPPLEAMQRSPHWQNGLLLPCRSARNWAELQAEAEAAVLAAGGVLGFWSAFYPCPPELAAKALPWER